MTNDEANAFEAIVSAEENADLAKVEAPEVDPRKDGIYYHATVADEIVHYQLVADHRVVALVRVAQDIQVDMPQGVNPDTLLPGTTFHPITITTPDGARMILTKGWTFRAPEGILNRTAIRAFVMPRLAKLLVRLYNLGA